MSHASMPTSLFRGLPELECLADAQTDGYLTAQMHNVLHAGCVCCSLYGQGHAIHDFM